MVKIDRLSGEAARDGDDSVDIGKLVLQIVVGKWWIALCVTLSILVGLFVFAITPKIYQADALIQLESRGGQMSLPTALVELTDTGSATAAEIEIIRSRLVLGQAVAALHLDWQAAPVLMPVIGVAVQRYDLPLFGFKAYARRAESISLDLLQVDPTWVEKPILLTITGSGKFDLTPPDGSILSGQVGVTLNSADRTFSLRVASLTGTVGRQFIIMQRDEFNSIITLRTNLTVEETGRGSNILKLRYKSDSAIDAQKVLNAISEAYVRQNIARGTADADSGLQFLNTQLPAAEKAVRDAEVALNDYRRKAQVVDLSFESQALLTQTGKLNTDLQTLQLQEDEIKQRYTPNHPVYRQLLNNRARLEAQLAQLNGEAESLPETQRNVLNMTHKLELAQELYTRLQTQAQNVAVMKASKIGSVRIIDLAQATSEPIAPRGSLILILAAMLGSILGVALVLLRAWLHRGVQDAEQIEKLGLPVFATVNYVLTAESSRSNKTDRLPILAITDPTNLAIEAFRSLRTSLHFGMLDAANNSLVMTSAAPGAGKSFTSVNLAVVMAEGGQRVCLIDGDMRRGHLRNFFGQAKNTAGLSEFLSGEKTLSEVMLKGPVEGLSFIGTGHFPPNPAELLMRPRMVELLSLLNKDYDIVIIDAPPTLAVTDPVLLGRIAGSLLVIVRHEATLIGEVDAVQRTMETAGVKITGAVLNAYNPRKATGSQYSYRYDYKSLK